MLPPINFTI
ncbi:Protein of unknown function [Bacillus mycoides]|nr:Protein of unknown function [Bacillus mycoides]